MGSKRADTPVVLYAKSLRGAGRLDWWWAAARQFTLCRETGDQAESGECPVHGGDACLFQFACVSDLEPVVNDALERVR